MLEEEFERRELAFRIMRDELEDRAEDLAEEIGRALNFQVAYHADSDEFSCHWSSNAGGGFVALVVAFDSALCIVEPDKGGRYIFDANAYWPQIREGLVELGCGE